MEEINRLPNKSILIRVYGDSLSMPRHQYGIPYYETYPELFKKKLKKKFSGFDVNLYNRSQGGNDIRKLFKTIAKDCAYFFNNNLEIIIIQSGIVDCAPRPVPQRVRLIIEKIKNQFLKKKIISYIHAHRANFIKIKGDKPFRKTNPSDYKIFLDRMIRLLNGKNNNILLINIPPTFDHLNQRSPGLQSSIKIYNHIIKKTINNINSEDIKLADIYTFINNDPNGLKKYISDGIHITKEAHKLYCDLLMESIDIDDKII